MSLTIQQKTDIASEVAKAAPPVAVTGATVAGVTVNDMILWTTLIYLVLQIAFLLYRWGRLHFGKDKGQDH
jgi:hypothetical protein